MRLFDRLAWSALALVAIAPVQAQDIPGSCLVSFNVKDTTFTTGAATFDCRQLEMRRLDLFKTINGLPPQDKFSGDAIAKELAAIEEQVRKDAAAKNWTALGLDVSGEFLGTLGLAACFGGASGCALGVIGKITALLGTISNATSEAEKTKQASNVESRIAAVRKQVEGKISPADKVRAQLVKEATGLCTDVKKYCVAAPR